MINNPSPKRIPSLLVPVFPTLRDVQIRLRQRDLLLARPRLSADWNDFLNLNILFFFLFLFLFLRFFFLFLFLVLVKTWLWFTWSIPRFCKMMNEGVVF
ncbi:hypothetical protein HanIR_Chr17g0900951 [Helianthus annuus]|nr:hypothetical protein HanIR_Chr17g0900951 [Helianthus annuus]